MTFKHIKFEDSVVMRSLEKLAKEKGLVKEDVLKKIASKKPRLDLSPSDNLTENLLKLCSGLRAAGFEKYAQELEQSFMIYKKASTEDFSKVVQEAHPKGSHKLEGVQGDAIIETILDQQLQDIKMVEKKPTGKLVNSKSIINAVKISLAQSSGSLYEKAQRTINQLSPLLSKIRNNIDPSLTFSTDKYQENIDALIPGITEEKLDEILGRFNAFIYRVKPGSIIGASKDAWAISQQSIQRARNVISAAMTLIRQANTAADKESEVSLEPDTETKGHFEVAPVEVAVEKKPEDAVEEKTPTKPQSVKSVSLQKAQAPIKSGDFVAQVNNALNTLNMFKNKISTDASLTQQASALLNWIDKKVERVNNIKTTYNNLDLDNKSSNEPGLLANLNNITSTFNKFRTDWID